jgi:Family of unknown function (DUF6491)
MKIKLILAAMALAAIAAPAYASDNVCLRHYDVDGWGARDNHSMVVNDRFGRKYLISLSGICNDLPFSFGVGFRPFGGFANMGTCVERGDRVVMRGGGATRLSSQTCWVTKVQPYTKEMEQADRLAKQEHKPLNTY